MTSAISRTHRLQRMVGRDPHEPHRAATPLELLYDLTFVVAFGQAADQFAHLIAIGHTGAAVVGLCFATFAICWAWINYSWFASAFDNDDWAFRLATMVQMIGVLIMALGLPSVFQSLEHGHEMNNDVTVAGYVIIRVAMIFLWLRAAKHNDTSRKTCHAYALAIGIAQLGWLATIFLHASIGSYLAMAAALMLVELLGPWLAERTGGTTPWHAHHIAERYGLLAIIGLGEGVLGTVASLSAVVQTDGWSSDAILIAVAGTGLTFGMWWGYFLVPSADVLHLRRDRAWSWGYGHIPIFGAIAATGGGLHVAAYYIGHQYPLGAVTTVLAVAIPVAVFVYGMFAIHTVLVRVGDAFHLGLMTLTTLVLGASLLLAYAGVGMSTCLVVLMLAPIVPVVGYESIGHRHVRNALARLEAGT